MMGLTARQRRVLDGIECALRASEPQMAAKFAMFTRLAGDDGPAMPERLSGFRLRISARLRAAVLVPVVFAMLITGALLSSGTARGSNCGPRLTGFTQNVSGRTVPGQAACRRFMQPGTPAKPARSARAARVGPAAPMPRLISPAAAH